MEETCQFDSYIQGLKQQYADWVANGRVTEDIVTVREFDNVVIKRLNNSEPLPPGEDFRYFYIAQEAHDKRTPYFGLQYTRFGERLNFDIIRTNYRWPEKHQVHIYYPLKRYGDMVGKVHLPARCADTLVSMELLMQEAPEMIVHSKSGRILFDSVEGPTTTIGKGYALMSPYIELWLKVTIHENHLLEWLEIRDVAIEYVYLNDALRRDVERLPPHPMPILGRNPSWDEVFIRAYPYRHTGRNIS